MVALLKKLAQVRRFHARNIIFSILTILLLASIHQGNKGYANVYDIGPHDSCNLLHLSLSEIPVCKTGQPNTINNYALQVTVDSQDHTPHTFTYTRWSDFCTSGTLQKVNGYSQCKDNQVEQTLTATTPVTITINRSPTTGSYCGSYQADFNINSIDGNSNCNYGHGSQSIGGTGICETKTDCTNGPTVTLAPTPTPITYTISGNVFKDTNKDKLLDNGEQNYTGAIDITATGGTVSTNNGSFTISGLSWEAIRSHTTTYQRTTLSSTPKDHPPPSSRPSGQDAVSIQQRERCVHRETSVT